MIKKTLSKPYLLEGRPWFKFNNVGLVAGMALKFYTSVAKVSKLKVRKFWRQVPTIEEVTGEKIPKQILVQLRYKNYRH